MYLSMYDSKPADGIALVARDNLWHGMAWRFFFFEHQTKTVSNGKGRGRGPLPPSSAHPACLVSNLKVFGPIFPCYSLPVLESSRHLKSNNPTMVNCLFGVCIARRSDNQRTRRWRRVAWHGMAYIGGQPNAGDLGKS